MTSPFQVILFPLAKADIEEITTYYLPLSSGAVQRFREELYLKQLQLAQYPESAERFSLTTRRLHFRSLPFTMYYRTRNTQVEIVAVLSQKLGPQKIRGRLTIH